MPVPAAAVPVTVSSIYQTTPTPAPVAGEAPLGMAAGGWAHKPHDHPHGGVLAHGEAGDHSHSHSHEDGTTHEHPHQHGHDHHDNHPDDNSWRLAGGKGGGASSHSHAHVHPHTHSHTYRAGQPVDTALVQAETSRGVLFSSGKVSALGNSINAGYAPAALKRPPVGSAAQMAAAGKSKPLAQTVVPSVVGHRDLMNTEDAAALDFGMPEPADEATLTPDDSIELDATTLHEGGHQPQAALGQSDMQIPRMSDAAALVKFFQMGVVTRAECRHLLGVDRFLDQQRQARVAAAANRARAAKHADATTLIRAGIISPTEADRLIPEVTR